MKTRMASLLAVSASLALTGCVVSPPGTMVHQAPPVPPSMQPAQSGPALGVEDVKALAKAGVSDALIINQINSSHTVYRLTATDIIGLKSAGVSDTVVNAMMATPTTVSSQPTATTASAVVVEPQPTVFVGSAVVVEPAPVYVGPCWWGWGWGWRGYHDRWYWRR